MVVKRKIPYGVINWAELVRDCFFVDNTAHIRALETCKTPVFLRPKRFGKTEIGRNPTDERNAYLVLKFDFSTAQVGMLKEIEERFVDNVRGAVGARVAAKGSALPSYKPLFMSGAYWYTTVYVDEQTGKRRSVKAGGAFSLEPMQGE